MSYINKEINKIPKYQLLLITLYLIIEYGRPQTFFHPLSAIRPAMIIQIFMIFYVFSILISFNFQKSQTKAMFLFLLIMIPHVFFANNNYWAFNILKTMFLYFIVHLMIITYVIEFTNINKVINIWFIIILLMAMIGILYGGKVPDSSLMGDENDFSLVMNMAIPIAFFFGLQSRDNKLKFFYFFTVGIFSLSNSIVFFSGRFYWVSYGWTFLLDKSPEKGNFIINYWCFYFTNWFDGSRKILERSKKYKRSKYSRRYWSYEMVYLEMRLAYVFRLSDFWCWARQLSLEFRTL